MTKSIELGRIARSIAIYYFEVMHRKATSATMRMSIGQAKSLLNSGYTEKEILDSIDYTVKHPPKGGFNSLGWLSYDIARCLEQIKAQEIKATQIAPKETVQVDLSSNKDKYNKPKGIGKSFGLDLFKEEK